jgi:hypothetical protein
VASATEISRQVERESERRGRLAVPAFAGGMLYLLSAIIIEATLKAAPTVGLLEGLKPVLSGEANPPVSPRTDEVKYISHHALALVAGSALAVIAVLALTLILLLLFDATSFRRPATWSLARPLVLFGGIAFALVSLAHQVVAAIETHNFAVGHDHSTHAVDQALTKSTLNLIVAYVALLAGLALAVGMIAVVLNALRVGLLPRWMGMLGMFTGLLIFLPIGGAELQIVPAFWMVMTGILFVGKWPNEEPPAWAAGEARPWPPGGRRGAAAAVGAPPAGTAGGAGDIAPAPARPARGASRKRRKRGSRG